MRKIATVNSTETEDEEVTLDLTFGTLSLELPIGCQIVNQYGKAEGPFIQETLTKTDGTSETFVSICDTFNVFAYSHRPSDDHLDLRALIQEKNPSLSQESVFEEGAINILGDAGAIYPGYFVFVYITEGQYLASLYGYLVVSLEDGWVVGFDVYYPVDRLNTTSIKIKTKYIFVLSG